WSPCGPRSANASHATSRSRCGDTTTHDSGSPPSGTPTQTPPGSQGGAHERPTDRQVRHVRRGRRPAEQGARARHARRLAHATPGARRDGRGGRMTSIEEQARAEAEKRRYSLYGTDRPAFEDGYLAGHEAATADDDARITRLVGVVTATTMLGPQDAETVVRALVAHAATRTRVVTTVAELDALADRTCIIDADMEFRQRHGTLLDFDRTVESAWLGFLSPTLRAASEIRLPARVLYEPQETR